MIYLVFELTWYSTNICLHIALHCCVEALQSLLQGIRLDVHDSGGIGCYLNVRGSHIQLHCQPIGITKHERVQFCHRDAVQKHLQVLQKGEEYSVKRCVFCLFVCLSHAGTTNMFSSLNVLTASSSPSVTTATDKGTVSLWTRAKRTPVLLDGRMLIFTSTFQLSEFPISTCTKFHCYKKQKVHINLTATLK